MESLVKCARCNGCYLHHGDIEIFDRKEDEEEGTHIKTNGDTVLINRAMAGNPSSRRDGIKIYCTCEYCDTITTVIEIVQHKGQTFIRVKEAT